MIIAENLRDWRGKEVIDPDGGRIGELEAGELAGRHEPGIFAHYRLPFGPGAEGTRRLARH